MSGEVKRHAGPLLCVAIGYRLEVGFEAMREDLSTIKNELKVIAERMAKMPSVGALWGMIATVLTTALAIIGTVIAVVVVVR